MMVLDAGRARPALRRPDRLGAGIGRRLVELAKERSPDGLDALHVPGQRPGAPLLRAATGSSPSGSATARPTRSASRTCATSGDPVTDGAPAAGVPDRIVGARRRADRGLPSGDGPPLVLVHGATADHTTWRTAGPLLAARHRSTRSIAAAAARPATARGEPYAIEREFDDLAAVVDAIAARDGRAGRRRRPLVRRPDRARGRAADDEPRPARRLRGRTAGAARGAATRTPTRGRSPDRGARRRGRSRRGAGDVHARDRRDADRGPRRLPGRPDLAAPRGGRRHDDPRAPRARRARPARSTRSARSASPVLQILGGASSAAPFGEATQALDARLRDGRVVTIDGARHAAHHTHAAEFVAAIEAFLAEPGHGRLSAMTDSSSAGSIIGFLGGALSGAVVGGRTARGCLPNIVVGVLGAIVGGWLAAAARVSAGPGLHRGDRRRRRSARSSSASSSRRSARDDRR